MPLDSMCSLGNQEVRIAGNGVEHSAILCIIFVLVPCRTRCLFWIFLVRSAQFFSLSKKS